MARNNGPNALHGGLRGFDKVVWRVDNAKASPQGPATLRLRYLSANGDQGYPGNLDAHVTYTLGKDNALRIDYDAKTDGATIVNLTKHSYFNLSGEASGDVLAQELQFDASRFTPVDATLIPTGELRSVSGTPFDFRKSTAIGARIRDHDAQILIAHGYDHNWVLDRRASLPPSLAARAYDPRTGRVLRCYTTEPGLFYSGNFLDGSEAGTSGRAYRQSDGFTLETQHFPDSPNHPSFPSTVLRPHKDFHSTTIFRFSKEVQATR